jgi:hypothetical protein
MSAAQWRNVLAGALLAFALPVGPSESLPAVQNALGMTERGHAGYRGEFPDLRDSATHLRTVAWG